MTCSYVRGSQENSQDFLTLVALAPLRPDYSMGYIDPLLLALPNQGRKLRSIRCNRYTFLSLTIHQYNTYLRWRSLDPPGSCQEFAHAELWLSPPLQLAVDPQIALDNGLECHVIPL